MNDQFDNIDKYLQDGLSEEEALNFEKELGSNPELAKEVNSYRIANEVTIQSKLIQVRESLSVMHLSGGLGVYATILKAGAIIGVSGILSIFIFNTYITSEEEIVPSVSLGDVVEIAEPDLNDSEEIVTAEDVAHQEEDLIIITDSHVTVSATVIDEVEVTLEEEVQHSTPSVLGSFEEDVAKTDDVVMNVEEAKGSVVEVETIKTFLVPHHNSISEVEHIIHEQEDSHNPCAFLRVATHIDVSPTCLESDLGSINIDLVKTNGATKPFFFSLDGVHYTMRNHFNKLKEGHYSLYIEDGQGCLVKASDMIFIKSKKCK
jgi:hypothetical protein